MSWNSYVDNLIGEGFTLAGIFGRDGLPWACSPSMERSAKRIVDHLDTQATSMLYFGDRQYMVIQNTGEHLYGKIGGGGITAVRTKQAIIVGIYHDKIQPGHANHTIHKIGDYLTENGY